MLRFFNVIFYRDQNKYLSYHGYLTEQKTKIVNLSFNSYFFCLRTDRISNKNYYKVSKAFFSKISPLSK